MPSVSPDESPRPRRRRVVRPAGTVGGDDANLRSSFPAPAPEEVPAPSGADRPPTRRTAPGRAPDDEDVGWGAPGADSNDDRLARDRPPHW